MEMDRREALRRLTSAVGSTLSVPIVGAILAGCRAETTSGDWKPRTLTREQADLLGVLVDLIIPATDTPGAKDVGVVGFIDKLLTDWVKPEERTAFVTGLADIDPMARAAHQVTFQRATPEQQTAMLTRLDSEAIEARKRRADPLPFFATLKEWTLVGYYTSETGATKELRWLATPGRYQGDLPVGEVGRTWA
jgi:gluconate 2-dehydrogenase gamma chain